MGRKKLATVCEVEDCGLTHEETRIVKGMCRKHYKRFTRNGVPFSETPKPGHWSWPPR